MQQRCLAEPIGAPLRHVPSSSHGLGIRSFTITARRAARRDGTACSKSSPAGVSTTPCDLRLNKGCPTACSSCRICWLIAGCEELSCWAALLKLPKRDAASKAGRLPSGGRSIMVFVLLMLLIVFAAVPSPDDLA